MTTCFAALRRRRARVLASLAWLLLSGCGLFTTHRQPLSNPASRMRVTYAEADDIDGWNALPAANSQEDGCAYWQGVRSREDDPSARIDEYLRLREKRACETTERFLARKAEREREEAQRRAELEANAAFELREGRCADDNVALFQQWGLFIKDAMKLRFDASGQPKMFSFIAQRLAVAGADGLQLELGPWFGNELHVFVFGQMPVSLEAHGSDGTPMPLASAYEEQVTCRCSLTGNCVMSQHGDPQAPEHHASRVALTSSRDRLMLDIGGQGCVLVMAFSAT